MTKLIIAWIIIITAILFLTHDKGIYYGEPYMEQCTPDYMGSCN